MKEPKPIIINEGAESSEELDFETHTEQAI